MAKEPEYFDFLGMQSKKSSDSNSLKRKSKISPFSRSDFMSKFCTAKRKKTSAPTKVQSKVTKFFNLDGDETNSGGDNREACYDKIPVRTKTAAIVKRTMGTTKTPSSSSIVPNSSVSFEDSSHHSNASPATLVKSLASITSKSKPVSDVDFDAFRKQVLEKAKQALRQMDATTNSEESPPIDINHLTRIATMKSSGSRSKSTLSSNTCVDLPLQSDPVVETVEPSVSGSQIANEIPDNENFTDETQLIPSGYIAASCNEDEEMVENVEPDVSKETCVPPTDNGVEIVDDVQPSVTEDTCLVPRVGVGSVDSKTITPVTISPTTELAPESESCGTNRLDDFSNISVTISSNVYLECSISLDQQDDTTENINDELESENPDIDVSISVTNIDETSATPETVNDSQQTVSVETPSCSSENVSISVPQSQECPSLQPSGKSAMVVDSEVDVSKELQRTPSVETPSDSSVNLPQAQECPLLAPNEGVASSSDPFTDNSMQVDAVPEQLSLLENNASDLQNESSCLNENVDDDVEMIASTSDCHEVQVSAKSDTNSSATLETAQPKCRRLSSDSQKSTPKMLSVKKLKEVKARPAKTSEESTPNNNLSSDNASVIPNQQENSPWDKSAAQFKLGLALDLELNNLFSICGTTSNESTNVSQSTNGLAASSNLGENADLKEKSDTQDPIPESSVCAAQQSTERKITSGLESTPIKTENSNNQERLKPKSYPNIIPLNVYLKFYSWYTNEWKLKQLDEVDIENRKPVCSCSCSLCDCGCHSKQQENKKLLEESQGALEEFFSGVEKWMQSSNRVELVQENPDAKKPKVPKGQKKNPANIKTRKRDVIEPLFEGLPEKRPIKRPIWHSEYSDISLRKNGDILAIDMEELMNCNPSAYRRACTLVNENKSDTENLLDVYKTVHSVFNPLKEISNVAVKCKTVRKTVKKEKVASQNDAPKPKKSKKYKKLRFYSIFSKKHRRKKPPPKQNNVQEPSSTKIETEAGLLKTEPQNSDETPMEDHSQVETPSPFLELEPTQHDIPWTLQARDDVSPSIEMGESQLDFHAQFQEQAETVELQPTVFESNSTGMEMTTNSSSSHEHLNKSLLVKQGVQKQPRKQTKKKAQTAIDTAPVDAYSSLQYREENTLAHAACRAGPSSSQGANIVESSEVNDIATDAQTLLQHESGTSDALSTVPTDPQTIAVQNDEFRERGYVASQFSNILNVLNLNGVGDAGSKLSIEEVYDEDDYDVDSVRNEKEEVQYQVDCAVLKDSLDNGIRRFDEELILQRLFFAQKNYLKNIMSGKVACARHKEFSCSTVSQINMPDFSVMIFKEQTLMALLNVMTEELNPELKKKHYESRSLFRNYYWNVLVPELIIKIFMDAYGISKSEAHRKIIFLQCHYKFKEEMYYFLD